MDSPTLGHWEARDFIAKRWGDGNPDGVILTQGSSEGIFLLLSTLLSPGDEVVAMSNSYHTFTSVPTSIGCQVKHWSIEQDMGFSIDLDRLASMINKNTKMIIVNFPHNPTGLTITPEQQVRLIELAKSVDAYLFWDGAFADMVYQAPALRDPINQYSKAISSGTFSKSFGMPGLRFGWCIACPSILERVVPLRDMLTICMSSLVEFVGYRCLLKIEDILKEKVEQSVNNLEVLRGWIKRNHQRVAWQEPLGGVSAFVRCKQIADTRSLCGFASERGVLLVPGDCFDSPNYVRLGFGSTSDKFKKALTILENLLCEFETYRFKASV